MTDSGFRPYPGKEIGKKWVDMGGTWMVTVQNGRYPTFTTVPEYWGKGFLYRPIHPAHGWNHYSWMWAEMTGEDMTPTEPGWYWWTGLSREDYQISWRPVEVYEHADHGLLADGGIGDEERPVWVGKWGGPVEGMPGEVGR